MMLRLTRRPQNGFTLAEMMAVIVIIGLLATIVVPNVLGKWEEAARTTARTDITTLVNAATEYAVRNGGKYPDTLDALVQPDERGHAYLQARTLPRDPWKQEYVYEPPIAGSNEPRPRIFSVGSDGAANTSDDVVEGGTR